MNMLQGREGVEGRKAKSFIKTVNTRTLRKEKKKRTLPWDAAVSSLYDGQSIT